jgi:hypothetical protein
MVKPAGIKGDGKPPQKIAFDYIKGQYFRVIHADGAIGGLTPQGNIQFALYSERKAIPRRQVHTIKPDLILGDVIPEETVSRDSIVREMDINVVMNPDVAANLAKWLFERVEELKNVHGK